jgi:two-component system, chemotaxis family, sensor kinase Cph1
MRASLVGASMTTLATTLEDVDLRACESEPIRIPGSIQPHGVLVALDPETLQVLQVSENVADHFGVRPEAILGKSVAKLIERDAGERLITDLGRVRLSHVPIYLREIHYGECPYHSIAHLADGLILLEFEPSLAAQSEPFRDLYALTSDFVARLGGLRSGLEVAEVAAEQIRELTKFDRVLVYEFDRQWNGTVIAESRNDSLPAYLDLRFPASDIPGQARDLYRLNPSRMIPTASYTPARLIPERNPKTDKPLDLTYATLRSVSPVHREYMVNMGTAASMSVSILRNRELWGLISCHNREAQAIGFDVRKACEFIGQVVSAQIEAHERNALFADRVRLKTIESELLAHMAHHDNFADGLVHSDTRLLSFANAEGAAVMHEGRCSLIGQTPDHEGIKQIIGWLSKNAPLEDVFHTDQLTTILPAASGFSSQVSGLLAVRISKLHNSYVLWFRPEVIQTVRWGGDPTAPKETDSQRVHPRKSFELWKETVLNKSFPFTRAEIDAVLELRNAIVGIVLRKAEEMAELTAQLRRSNKELEAFSYSVSHDLRAPFRHIVGYAELLRERETASISAEGSRFVECIIESAQFAGQLVDNLLNFSRMARASLSMMKLNLTDLVEETRRELVPESKGRNIEWKIGKLPVVIADPIFLRLAMRNLLSNSIKYTRMRELASIEVTSTTNQHENVICVRDNGVGFDMRYVEKLFGVFQRLHRIEEFEGTGIGLANVRRIIERHGGRTWAEGQPGKGAAFYFSLPSINTHEGEQGAETDFAG